MILEPFGHESRMNYS